MGIDLDEISLIATFPCDPDLDFFCSRRFSEKNSYNRLNWKLATEPILGTALLEKKNSYNPLHDRKLGIIRE